MTALRASQSGGPHHVVVGVTGGIAAYKACILVRLLMKAGLDVTVIPTRAALEMVGRTTWEALTGKPVYTDVTDDAVGVAHVRLGQEADLVIIAPATAHTLAKIRAGMADNLLTSTILVATCPVVMAPAMHTEMWLNPATQDNIAVLRKRGLDVLEPAVGRLTGPDSGPGRMPEPEDLAEYVLSRLSNDGELEPELPIEPVHSASDGASSHDLVGRHVVVSAGGTHEAIDPVRYIGNNSSGVFGVEIAAEALRRGARVTLVAANIPASTLEAASGVEVVPVVSAAELHEAMDSAAKDADIIIMSAAVADFRPAAPAATKQKKTGERERIIELVENPDILVDLAHHRRRSGQTIVGFAAETGDDSGSVVEYGRQKAARKGADLMVINEVGSGKGFGNVSTSITLIDRAGMVHATGTGSKGHMARVIFDTISSWRFTH
ncbi:MAG: bifunctional phosphopantothenoylcysteine decarboxylase/phosphopantothenate--cysteine ligase CoaBC [Ancrocorticia sp.]